MKITAKLHIMTATTNQGDHPKTLRNSLTFPWRRTLRGEGHSVAGWGINGSVIAADCAVQSPFIRAMGCRYLRSCAAPHSVIASQYATSNCKPAARQVAVYKCRDL